MSGSISAFPLPCVYTTSGSGSSRMKVYKVESIGQCIEKMVRNRKKTNSKRIFLPIRLKIVTSTVYLNSNAHTNKNRTKESGHVPHNYGAVCCRLSFARAANPFWRLHPKTHPRRFRVQNSSHRSLSTAATLKHSNKHSFSAQLVHWAKVLVTQGYIPKKIKHPWHRPQDLPKKENNEKNVQEQGSAPGLLVSYTDMSMAVLFPLPCSWLWLSDSASEVSRMGELLPVEETRLLGILSKIYKECTNMRTRTVVRVSSECFYTRHASRNKNKRREKKLPAGAAVGISRRNTSASVGNNPFREQILFLSAQPTIVI